MGLYARVLNWATDLSAQAKQLTLDTEEKKIMEPHDPNRIQTEKNI